jgi:hypothetical protein
VRAAFVALTVAGQQGISRSQPDHNHFRFSIADFGLGLNLKSKIKNLKWPGLARARLHPFPLIRLQPIIDFFYLSNPSIAP